MPYDPMQVRRLHDTFHEPFRRTLRQQQLHFEASQATQAGGAGPSTQAAAPAEPGGKEEDDAPPLHAASPAEAASLAAEAQSHKDGAPDAAMLTDRGLAEVHDESGDDESGQG